MSVGVRARRARTHASREIDESGGSGVNVHEDLAVGNVVAAMTEALGRTGARSN